MADNVTRQEMMAELKSIRYEMRLLLVIVVITLKFDVPDPVTVTAVIGVLAKTAWSAFIGRIGA